MSKYNVGAYIRISRDESYSDSDSIDNQIKLVDYYCENQFVRNIIKKRNWISPTSTYRNLKILQS